MRYLVLLLLVLGCSVPPRLTVDPNGLPPLPDVMETAGGLIPVVWMDSIPTNEPHTIILGQFRPLEWEIRILKVVTGRTEQWRIAFHEQCHAELWVAALRYTDANLERTCDAWAYNRLRALSNPGR